MCTEDQPLRSGPSRIRTLSSVQRCHLSTFWCSQVSCRCRGLSLHGTSCGRPPCGPRWPSTGRWPSKRLREILGFSGLPSQRRGNQKNERWRGKITEQFCYRNLVFFVSGHRTRIPNHGGVFRAHFISADPQSTCCSIRPSHSRVHGSAHLARPPLMKATAGPSCLGASKLPVASPKA